MQKVAERQEYRAATKGQNHCRLTLRSEVTNHVDVLTLPCFVNLGRSRRSAWLSPNGY
jgi:hypothetical protein